MPDGSVTLHAAWEGLRLVVAWPNILYPIAATLLAMIVAFLPGISGVTLMALAVPFTLFWDPLHVLLFFGALVGGATFMGSITAILFNVPGTGPSAATLLDGHPMAQQGHAKTAIGCAAMASAMGSSFGILVLVALIPFIGTAIRWFGPPELLMLLLWGLTTIALISRGSVSRALAATGIGLLLSFVGQDPRTGEARFTLGSLYLWDGLGLVPVMLGLFSIAEMIDLGRSSRVSISGHARVEQLAGSVKEGALSVFRHFGLFLRSASIGTCVGMVPGVGGTVASFLAYGHAVGTARNRERFGKGDIRGVLAPEAAHDAKDGGALVPVLAFGIPGSDSTSVLLAALLLHGLAPGRELMTNQLPLVFVLIWSLFLSNWLTSILGLLLVSPLARLTTVGLARLAPIGIVLAGVGAFVSGQRLGDVVVAVIFGVLGYFMKKHDWPRIALLVALLLGGGIERNFEISASLYHLGRIDLWARPLLLLLGVLALLNVFLPRLRAAKQQWRRGAGLMTLTGRTILTLILMLVVGTGIILASRLGPVARTAPLIVAIPTLTLLTIELVRDHSRGRRRTPPDNPEVAAAERRLIGWLILLIVLAATLGIMFGTAVWLALYLRLRSGERWVVASGFGVGLALVLYAVFTLVLRIPITAGGLLNY